MLAGDGVLHARGGSLTEVLPSEKAREPGEHRADEHARVMDGRPVTREVSEIRSIRVEVCGTCRAKNSAAPTATSRALSSPRQLICV